MPTDERGTIRIARLNTHHSDNPFDIFAQVVPGPAFDLANEQLPLHGKYVTLQPLSEGRAASFFKNSGLPEDTTIWKYVRSEPPKNETEFCELITGLNSRPEFSIYAITTDVRGNTTQTTAAESEETLGIIGYLDINRSDRTVEIGFVLFTPKLQRTRAATEAHYLALKYVCEPRDSSQEGLAYRRAWWKCNAMNAASVRAAKRLGYVYEGRLRNHMISQGRSRDSEVLSILDDEWPRVKAAFEKWLEDGNFDAQGGQIKTLTQVRQELSGN